MLNNLINKVVTLLSPAMPPTTESLKDLRAKTKALERQAEFAETEAKLLDRAKKAKKRIKAVRTSNIRPIYIIISLVLLGIIILVISSGS